MDDRASGHPPRPSRQIPAGRLVKSQVKPQVKPQVKSKVMLLEARGSPRAYRFVDTRIASFAPIADGLYHGGVAAIRRLTIRLRPKPLLRVPAKPFMAQG